MGLTAKTPHHQHSLSCELLSQPNQRCQTQISVDSNVPGWGCRCQTETGHRSPPPPSLASTCSPLALLGHLAKVKPLIGQQQVPVPTMPGVPGAVGLWLSWLRIRARSQSQLHEELPQLRERSRSEQWEEGQSHLGSSGGKVHPLGWGGAGKESLSKGLAELWVWLGPSAEPSSVQPKSKVCVPADPGTEEAGLTRCAGRTIGHCAALSPL